MSSKEHKAVDRTDSDFELLWQLEPEREKQGETEMTIWRGGDERPVSTGNPSKEIWGSLCFPLEITGAVLPPQASLWQSADGAQPQTDCFSFYFHFVWFDLINFINPRSKSVQQSNRIVCFWAGLVPRTGVKSLVGTGIYAWQTLVMDEHLKAERQH